MNLRKAYVVAASLAVNISVDSLRVNLRIPSCLQRRR
jgi:hypothetical protein